MELRLTAVQQVPPITNSNAQVQVSFDLLGILPDFVQIYAANAAGSGPANLVDSVDIQKPENHYDKYITLQAGTFYAIYACPRTGSQDNPDEYIDDEHWYSYCAIQTILTQSISSPSKGDVPPVINSLDPQPATLNSPNTITVGWTTPTSYQQYQVAWSYEGEALAQINTANKSYSFGTDPGHHYTFAVQGGIYGGAAGNYHWSAFGPTVRITASPNLHSLRQFLQHSGLNPSGQKLSALIHAGGTLRKFMNL